MAGRTAFDALLHLCKARGFVFQSAEIYGGLRGCYDYGPLGVELKRNIANEWWRSIVHARDDVVGVDTAIMAPRDLFAASGHLELFTDRLSDCALSGTRFRADKAAPLRVGPNGVVAIAAPDAATAIEWAKRIAQSLAPGAAVDRKGSEVRLVCVDAEQTGEGGTARTLRLRAAAPDAPPVVVPFAGYASPANSPFVGPERLFNAMFRTSMGVTDAVGLAVDAAIANRDKPPAEMRAAALAAAEQGAVYLRPETAQGIFTQFTNVMHATGRRPPFGIAQIGKAFRNEISVEHFVFRSREFEQMELEYFCGEEAAPGALAQWTNDRLAWWKGLLRHGDARLRTVQHKSGDLAHYARACTDIEYEFPFGWGEVEGIAWRGDYDLAAHAKHTGAPLRVKDGATGAEWTPHVVEPSAGLTRAFLAVLCDAFSPMNGKEGHPGQKGDGKGRGERVVLGLHPRLAPYKAAVFPVVGKAPELVERASAIYAELRRAGIPSTYDKDGSIGKRYVVQDEIGTPCCITVDSKTVEDGTVTVRDRDTGEQRRVRMDDVVQHVRQLLV